MIKHAPITINQWQNHPFNNDYLTMYIIKVKGVAKIPDYVQLRDDKFTLLAYFRLDRPEKSLDRIGLHDKTDYIINLAKDLPFGQILKLDF